MVGLIRVDQIPAFREIRNVAQTDVTEELRSAVRQLHEADDIEEFLRAILSDRAATPHGPAEIADIVTHRVQLNGTDGLAAFVLKGRSYASVRPRDISHQIYRLEKIDDLALAVLGATEVVLDAVKEQFSSTSKRLGVSYTFLDTADFARLFWAYGFLCPRDGARITGGRCHCGYAPNHSVLNILQEDALIELDRARSLRQTKALVVLPPASGKTRIAALDAKAYGAKTILYVAHTNEILEIANDEFAAVFGQNSVTRLDQIKFISNHLAKLTEKHFDYIVMDEFHHAAAATYRRIVNELRYSFLLGLTATPFRGDRQDIAALCDGNIVVQYELRSGIDAGVLTAYHYFGCFDDINYQDLPSHAGGYSIRDLERKLIIRERHQAIVEKWIERAEGKPTLAFCCSHVHARKVADEFSTNGIPAEPYLSSTSLSAR